MVEPPLAGWSGPAYDEADVSDKPSYVRRRPRLDEPTYGLQARCEQLLAVDWVIGNVRDAFAQSGRVGNTLQILTADNGWHIGDHRFVGKSWPYTTSVPLYMRWPKVLENRKRTVVEPVSSVDYARTFCALAGCSMKKSDGRSLLPLIEGTRSSLGRKFVYAELLHNGAYFGKEATAWPAWAGVGSTLKYSNTRWAYARYRTGKEELYDLSADPHRLRSLAGMAAHKPVLKDMRGFMRGAWERDDVKWKSKLTLWSK